MQINHTGWLEWRRWLEHSVLNFWNPFLRSSQQYFLKYVYITYFYNEFAFCLFQNAEFSFLLKERVCALVIKLFSPNIKYRNTVPAGIHQVTSFDKPYFPISMRLLRVVSILIQKYHNLLVTECEIFLSLIVKFLDPDKPTWQRSLALEVLHKMTIQPELLNSFCECYDLKKHTTSIFQDIVNSLGAYVQSLFISPQLQMANTSKCCWFQRGKRLITFIFSANYSRTTTHIPRWSSGWRRNFSAAWIFAQRRLASYCRHFSNRPSKVHLVWCFYHTNTIFLMCTLRFQLRYVG